RSVRCAFHETTLSVVCCGEMTRCWGRTKEADRRHRLLAGPSAMIPTETLRIAEFNIAYSGAIGKTAVLESRLGADLRPHREWSMIPRAWRSEGSSRGGWATAGISKLLG